MSLAMLNSGQFIAPLYDKLYEDKFDRLGFSCFDLG